MIYIYEMRKPFSLVKDLFTCLSLRTPLSMTYLHSNFLFSVQFTASVLDPKLSFAVSIQILKKGKGISAITLQFKEVKVEDAIGTTSSLP